MFETIEQIDRSLFLDLNGAHNAVFDVIMKLISSVAIWIPLYLFLIYLIYKRIGKKIIVALLCVAVMIIFTDQSSNLIKKSVKRARPTHNTEIQQQVHTVDDYKGGKYGFVSAHAANTFAIAFFVILLLKEKKNWFKLLLILWAMIVSYSRIYLGVHYPTDVIGGAILGTVWAFILYYVYTRIELKTA